MSLLALQDLFRRHREKATGVWRLGREPGRTVFLDMGDIVFAQSTHAMDRLTHLLVERGRLTQAQLDYALANLKPGLSIGKNLIDMGFITQRDLLEVARFQVERIVAGALGTPDQTPEFQATELEGSVVRLPLESPLLLLNALLGLKDREGILELLGPLNQVVVLQGRRALEMSLPADLAKLPPFFDGTHTLLELSREGLAEPLRLGAFALFLREMGWGRLHEMPPIARQALDLALTPDPSTPSEPLPEPTLETVPSLFSTIEAAARPTTNLDHLSAALDALPDPVLDEEPPLPAEAALPGFLPAPEAPVEVQESPVATDQAFLPTPSFPLPPLPEDVQEPESERPVAILPDSFGTVDPLPPPPEDPMATPSRSRVPALGLLLVLLGGGLGAWFWMRQRRMPQKPQVLGDSAGNIQAPGALKVVEKPAPAPVPEPGAPPAAPVEAPRAAPAPVPAKEDAKPVPFDVAARLEALKKGDLSLAVRQGARRIQAAGKGQWTLRLEIACQRETIQKAVGFFGSEKPDLFVAPMTLRDGRPCYQVFFGHFPNQAAAERHVRALPSIFRSHGNKPKSFRFSEIPSKQ